MPATLWRVEVQTPVGPMLAVAGESALCALEFDDGGRLERLEARFRRWIGAHEIVAGRNDVLDAAARWLDAYFAGGDAPGPRLDMRGTPFELQVWAALCRIPRGTTTTYGAIARELDSPRASRAVGLANGANPLAIIVPCHRVIGAGGTLTGYGGGLDRKAWLLGHERRWQSAPQAQLPLGPAPA